MNVEILCVGTEILLGNIVNTNTAYLAKRCADLGLGMYYQGVVGDNEERLEEAIEQALKRSDVLILSGGLGPTNDDITKETVAKVLGLELVFDQESFDNMDMMLKKLGHANYPLINNKQAYIPEGARALKNNNGTAPGIFIETNKTKAKNKYPEKIVALLPGPPLELKPMFEEYLAPFFKEATGEVIYSKMLKMIGIGEGAAADRIKDILINSKNPTVAPYAKINEVHFRITAKAKDETEALSLIAPVYEQIKNELGEYIYSEDEDETLQSVVVKKAKEKGLRLATAESCTGGLVAGAIIDVSGASDCFDEGFITYSNNAKVKTIEVSEETLKKYGAVSKECAMEMAKKAAIKARADVAVSTTGIAGPTGATKDKPVGRVYIGVYSKGEAKAFEFNFKGTREIVRTRSVVNALNILRKEIENY